MLQYFRKRIKTTRATGGGGRGRVDDIDNDTTKGTTNNNHDGPVIGAVHSSVSAAAAAPPLVSSHNSTTTSICAPSQKNNHTSNDMRFLKRRRRRPSCASKKTWMLVFWATVGGGCFAFIFSVRESNANHDFTLLFLTTMMSSSHEENSTVQQQGTQHRIELYSYHHHPQTLLQQQGQQQQPQRQPFSLVMTTWKDNDSSKTSHCHYKNLDLLADSRLVSRHEIVPIDVAHRQGLLHRGIWIAVLRRQKRHNTHTTTTNDYDDAYQILLMKRAMTLRTCPGAWSLVGEHSDPGEAWHDTARRALVEELQVNVVVKETEQAQPISSSHNTQKNYTTLAVPINKRNNTIVNLVPQYSVLVRSHYAEMKRFEFQATGLLAIVLDDPHVAMIQPDEEVDELQWVDLDYKNKDDNNTLLFGMNFCNPDITALAHFMFQRVIEMLQQ